MFFDTIQQIPKLFCLHRDRSLRLRRQDFPSKKATCPAYPQYHNLTFFLLLLSWRLEGHFAHAQAILLRHYVGEDTRTLCPQLESLSGPRILVKLFSLRHRGRIRPGHSSLALDLVDKFWSWYSDTPYLLPLRSQQSRGNRKTRSPATTLLMNAMKYQGQGAKGVTG